MDIGETFAQPAIREVKEEKGFDIRIDRIIGIYADPGHVFAYDDGEVRQEFSICGLPSTPAGAAGCACPVGSGSESVRAIGVGHSAPWAIRHLGPARPETVAEVRNRVISFRRGR